MKIVYLTDSGTGKNCTALQNEDIISLPLQISVDTTNYNDMEDLSTQECINLLKEKKVLKTSQPAPGKIVELFEECKKTNTDKIIAVPICHGLSGTMSTIQSFAKQYNIQCICFDTHVTAVVQERCIRLIRQWTKENVSFDIIQSKIENIIASCNTLLLPTDLQHLKRGGRLTPLAATVAGLLKIQPVLTINKKTSGKIDILAKVRTYSKAVTQVIEQMKNDGVDSTYEIVVAHVDDEQGAHELANSIIENFHNVNPIIIPLCNVVAAHTGLGCKAIQYFKQN